MRITYVISTLERTGPVFVLLNILAFLDRNKIVPTIVTLSPEPENTLRSRFHDLDVEILSVNLPRFSGALRLPREVGTRLRKSAPDIVHSHCLRSDLLNSLIKSRTNKPWIRITTCHNIPWEDNIYRYGPIKGRTISRIHLALYARLCNVVSISPSVKRALETRGIQTRCIANGVNLNIFHENTEKVSLAVRRRFDLPSNRLVLVYTGPLNQCKQPDLLISAFLLSKLRHQGTLFIVGDGPLMEKCKELAEGARDADIRLIGHQKDVTPILACSDLYISGSLSEGYGMSIAEAICSGLPCYLSSLPAHQCFGDSFPSSIKFFSPQSKEELIRLFDETTPTGINKMRNELACSNKDYCSAERMAKGYQMLYADLLA